MKFLLGFLLLTPLVPAQAPSVQAEWDISQTIAALVGQSARLTPLLDQINPQDWVARGASETYVAQWRSAKQELAYLGTLAQTLQRQPEKLTVALETYFRLQNIDTQLRSLMDGVRTYQNPAVADLVAAVMGENSGNRDRLQAYITDLATQKEQEFSVIDREAQRCRTNLNRAPARSGPATAAPKRPAVKQ
jgi:flagellar biosynthesis chaperone FliJ